MTPVADEKRRGKETMGEERKQKEPRPYQPEHPLDWWLKRPVYTLYIVRELSSVFVALFVLLHLLYFLQLGAPAAEFEQAYTSPLLIGLHVVILIFSLYHTVTWLALTGVIQVVKAGGKRVPPGLITGGAFTAWIVVSAAVAAFLIGRVG